MELARMSSNRIDDHTDGMDLIVWVNRWLMECCGDPFSIGSYVSWRLGPVDDEFLAVLPKEEIVAVVATTGGHHSGLSDDMPATRGTVAAITAVRCRYASGAKADPCILYPVAGSAVLSALDFADGWTPDLGELEFVGYLVHLTVSQ
ncbi:hypothetical protein HS041_27845 [Planomonospora sp. ID67723]|uniref:DUF6578 domain-containing protein n=1 Tax=Planomonospora sp. ID67723 TaxID=2738134 RepID=UPI0018C3DF5B|nr:DUF6578 domain-containing protein [Planomonospora sp. ID67723]MBG0831552.1 hypothetical protein [Planomonospora sp. ID67723]